MMTSNRTQRATSGYLAGLKVRPPGNANEGVNPTLLLDLEDSHALQRYPRNLRPHH